MTFPERAHAWLDAGVAVPEATDEITTRLGAQDKRIGALYLAQASGGQVLTEILAELKQIRAALNMPAATASASRSSVELEDMASGKTKLVTKVYDGSPLGSLGDEAIAEHGRLRRRLEERILSNWAAEVGDK